MHNTLFIVPSRSRPQNIERLVQGFVDTDSQADLLIALDDDDEANYPRLESPPGFQLIYEVNPSQRIGPIINSVATKYADTYKYLGFMGDDHCPRTPGWDQTLTEQIGEFGIAYGDDLLQGATIPTAVVMSSNIVRVLGYMIPPGLQHLYFDNTWKIWGEAQGKLFYVPEVIIEHIHPFAGKTEWDEGYERANSEVTNSEDRAVFVQYMNTEFISDMIKLEPLNE